MKVLLFLLLATTATAQVVDFGFVCDGKTYIGYSVVTESIDTAVPLTTFELIERNYPYTSYIFERDESGFVNWFLFCANDSTQCELFQSLTSVSVTIQLKYHPGQTVYIRYKAGQKSEPVKISTFDQYKSGASTYPAIVLGSTVYYYVNQRGFWSYIAEEYLHETPN